MERKATRYSWSYNQMVNPIKKPINLIFNKDEYTKIKIGFIPEMMEEKWFVFFENNWIHWVRSWTGEEWIKAEIKKEKETYIMSEYYLEEGVSNDKTDEEDAKIFESFMNVLIHGLKGIYMI